MAQAIIGGLIRDGVSAEDIRVADPSKSARASLTEEFGVRVFADAAEAVGGADILVLAVKPQVMPQVLEGISGQVSERQLVISIAAGVTIATMAAAFGDQQAIVRTMPNTPALLGYGITGMYAAPSCDDAHRASAEQVLGACGKTVWVSDEALMDTVTAVSGSGPAYFFLLIEAMRDAGTRLGLPTEVALELALETARGAGQMAASSEFDVAELRRRVTSPGGTTQAALEFFEAGGFRELVDGALTAADQRGRDLAGGTDGDH